MPGLRHVPWKLAGKPLAATAVVFVAASAVVVGLTVLRYHVLGPPDGFWDRVLAESYGMLMDLLVIGGLVLWLNQKGRTAFEVQRCRDEIDDFRDWRFQEAAFRISGNIRRLNRHGITDVDLNRCTLRNMHLSAVNLENASLLKTDLQGAYLARSVFRSADLNGANLKHAFCFKADFTDTVLVGADLRESTFENAVLRGAYVQGADLARADLTGADLTGARGLTAAQLTTVKTLHRAVLDAEIQRSIQEQHPGLFDAPA